jgi:hypothetical protein
VIQELLPQVFQRIQRGRPKNCNRRPPSRLILSSIKIADQRAQLHGAAHCIPIGTPRTVERQYFRPSGPMNGTWRGWFNQGV